MKKKLLEKTQFGNPILRNKAKAVDLKIVKTKVFKTLVESMFFTMHKSKGVGLAAPQINKPLQLAVIEIKPAEKKNKLRPDLIPLPPHIIINPKIIDHSKKTIKGYEGCLSLNDVRGEVPRFEKIAVSYFDEFGKKQIKTFKGFQARVFQHEIDHLNGTLYIDRIKDIKTLITLKEFRKRNLKTKNK